jgi:hypothetical protein
LWANSPYHVYWVAIEGFSTSNSLMLHMCGMAVFFVPSPAYSIGLVLMGIVLFALL